MSIRSDGSNMDIPGVYAEKSFVGEREVIKRSK